MADPPENPSMYFFGFTRRNLATVDIALAMADMLFAEVYGEEEAKAQRPLKVTDNGDRWTIKGSKDYEAARNGWPLVEDGPALVEIVKRNCAVINLIQFTSVRAPSEDDLNGAS
jgi:hypothetical protein